jgi:HlyD family secretion protein
MKKIKMIIATALGAVFILVGCSAAQNGVNITVAQVKTDSSISDTTYSSTTEAAATRNVFPNITGKVTGIKVTVGDQVKAGDVLFTLDDTDAQLQARQARLNADASTLTPARVARDEAEKNYERTQSLFDIGAASQADLDAAKDKRDTTAAQLETAEKSAQLALDTANKKLSDTVVTAPIFGQVAAKNIEVGDMASTQVAAFTLINASQVQIIVHVTEKNMDQVSLNMPAKIALAANAATYQGKVTEITPAVDPKTGLFDVKITVDNKNNQIKPGMAVNVTLQANGKPGVLLVPKQAIVTEGDQSFVYVVTGGKLKKCAVQTGKVRNAYMEILKGLAASDQVVVQGSGQVTEDSKFNIVSTLF